MHQDALPPESVDVFCYAKNMRGVMRNMVYQLLAECIDLRLKPVEQENAAALKRCVLVTKPTDCSLNAVVSVQLENSIDFYRSISTNKLKARRC